MPSQAYLKKIPLISLNVFIDYIKEIDNKKITEEIKNFSKPIDDKFLDNKNHSYYEDMKYPFDQEESEKLIPILTKKVSEIVGKEMEMEAIWSLTLDNGQSVSMHSHKSNSHKNHEEYYSIAYYSSAPEGSASLSFSVAYCNTIEKSIEINPEPGMLIVFNSFIPHMTNRHSSDTPRTVISANFVPKNPDNADFQDWSAYQR
jgi:uncharacterized RmlC-like cupin family protein